MSYDDEHLIRYLMGDLTPDATRQLKQRLADDAVLAERLDRLRSCLEASGAIDAESCQDQAPSTYPEEEAPAGLASRTSDSVAGLCLEELRSRDQRTSQKRSVAEPTSRSTRRCSVSLMQVAAAGVVLFMLGMMTGPALLGSRESARAHQCETNLADLGRLMFRYAADHGGRFPDAGPYQNNGMYTVLLAAEGYAETSDLERWVVCPSSPLAEEIAVGRAQVWIPEHRELPLVHSTLYLRARQLMGGSYAYRTGHFEEVSPGVHRYVPPNARDDARAALMSDAPHPSRAHHASMNHGCTGQYVLFQDNSVKFMTSCRISTLRDHLFLNEEEQVAPSRSWNDTVLVRSDFCPASVYEVQRVAW